MQRAAIWAALAIGLSACQPAPAPPTAAHPAVPESDFDRLQKSDVRGDAAAEKFVTDLGVKLGVAQRCGVSGADILAAHDAILTYVGIGRKPRAMTVLANQLSDAMRTGRNAVQDRGENNMCGGAAGSLAAIRQRTRMEGG